MPAKHKTLAQVAEDINLTCEGLSAKSDRSWSNTDRKISGTRLRSVGKGRSGSRLRVRDETIPVPPASESLAYLSLAYVYDHDTSETYRTVSEASEWLEQWKRDNPSRVSPLVYYTRQQLKSMRPMSMKDTADIHAIIKAYEHVCRGEKK